MKVWITKYALTTGIEVLDGEVLPEISSSMIVVKRAGFMTQHFHGNDWHTTEADAIKRAMDMRDKRLKSLRKQVDALAMLTFNVAGSK